MPARPPRADPLPYRRGAGVVLINPAGLIFAGQRRDTATPAWQMPQGGIEPGESARAAALRELEEETGVAPERVRIMAETPAPIRYDLPADLLGRVWGGRYRGQEQVWFVARFLGADDEIDIATAHPEFSSWRWIDKAALLAAIVPFKRALYAEVLAAFDGWLA